MEEVKKRSKFKYIFYFLFLLFSALYISGQTGYYENKLSREQTLTKEAIIEFEKDINEGKPVDIKDYLEKDHKDYENKYSSLGYTLSNSIDKLLNEGLKFIVKVIQTLFT